MWYTYETGVLAPGQLVIGPALFRTTFPYLPSSHKCIHKYCSEWELYFFPGVSEAESLIMEVGRPLTTSPTVLGTQTEGDPGSGDHPQVGPMRLKEGGTPGHSLNSQKRRSLAIRSQKYDRIIQMFREYVHPCHITSCS